MEKLKQRNKLKTFEFEKSDEGVLVREVYFLRFQSKERYVSFHELGMNVVKSSNKEGLPTLIIIGFMSIVSSWLIFKNATDKLPLAIFFFIATLFYVLVIIYVIQKYMTTTFELTGGNESITFLRYKSGETQTLQFIEEIKTGIQKALIRKYNELAKHVKPDGDYVFPLMDPDTVLNDEDYRLLNMKTGLLFSSFSIEFDEEEEWD